MKLNKLDKSFFNKNASIVAKNLLGKILVFGNKKARIVETEAYFSEWDPASRASKGKNKVSEIMIKSPGTILIYNVHKYNMLNFVVGEKGDAQAVLIRALEPLNFDLRCSGPGLLTQSLEINKSFNNKNFEDFFEILEDNTNFEIKNSFRIGVKSDLNIPLRFYIKNNKFVSKK